MDAINTMTKICKYIETQYSYLASNIYNQQKKVKTFLLNMPIDWIGGFVSLHPVLKLHWIDIPWLVHAKLWSCHNFDILVEKINMFCYSSNTFCAHNHFPRKLLFHPKITYIGYKVPYGYTLDLFIASIIDTNFLNKSDR